MDVGSDINNTFYADPDTKDANKAITSYAGQKVKDAQ